MLSTRELLDRLAASHEDEKVSEEQLRRAIRTGKIAPPISIAGRFVWSEDDVRAVANALGLRTFENATPTSGGAR